MHVVIQNQELLGVKAQPPERDEPVPMRGRVGPALTSSMRGNVPRGGTQGMQGVQGLAAGLFERAQAAGQWDEHRDRSRLMSIRS